MTAPAAPTVALAAFRLAPLGGLEQHCLRLAEAMTQRGWRVTLVTTRPPEDAPPGVEIERIAPRGRTNHGRLTAFAEDAARAAAGRFDRTVAFHTIPGFEIIVSADASRGAPGPIRGLMPRYRTYARLEREGLAGARVVLCVSEAQARALAHNAGLPMDRFVVLPPAAAPVTAPAPGAREAACAALGLEADAPVWLWVGVHPRTKGLDRVLVALTKAPRTTRLLIAGPDVKSAEAIGMIVAARRLGLADRISWLGYADAERLAQARASADLFVHPARVEAAGLVILEALASGLPAIVSAVCGYASHVTAAGAGVVLPEPFQAADLTRALEAATPAQLAGWREAALAYAAGRDLFGGLERAADIIADPALASAPAMA